MTEGSFSVLDQSLTKKGENSPMSESNPNRNPAILEMLRRIINETKPKQPKPLQPPRILPHGWLLPYLVHIDAVLWHRWDHWYETTSAQTLIGRIPKIEWQKDQAGFKMLDRSLSAITKYGDWRGWN